MKKYILIAIYIAVYVSVSSNGYSLTNVPLFTTVKSSEKGLGISVPSDAGLFENNTAAFHSIPKVNHLTFQVQSFPLSAKTSVDLEVSPFQILAPNATVCIGTAQGDVAINQKEATFLRGHIKGDPNSFVYLAVFENHTSGYIEYSNQSHKFERVVIAPTSIEKGKNSVMVVSQEQQTNLRVHCETESMPNYQSEVQKSFALLEEYKKNKSEQPLNSQTLVSTLAVECNFDFYKMHNSNLTETVNYALTVMGAASAIFERDMNIVFQINYLRVWTVPDPFVGENNRDIFFKFDDYWNKNMQHIPRSIAKLISGSFLGGIADIRTNCNNFLQNNSFSGVSVSGMEKNAVFPTKNFVGEINTLTHELGHSLGSPHTHSCEWNPPIDSCYTAEGNCFVGIKGSTGTIMSYCYLNPLFTRLNFHPRVAGLIRTIAESSPCLAIHTNRQFSDDLSLEKVIFPISGGTITPNKEFIPAVLVKNIGKNSIQNGEIICYLSKKEENHRSNSIFTLIHSIEPINSGEVRTISFEPISLEHNGDYIVTFEVNVTNDSMKFNNILSIPIFAGQPNTEILQLDPIITNKIYQVGDNFPISWQTTLQRDVRIDYSLDSGISWQPVISRIPAQEKQYNWVIPAQSTKYGKIKISAFDESNTVDISESYFVIDVNSDVLPINITHPKHAGKNEMSLVYDTLLTTKVLIKNTSSTTAFSVPVYIEIVHSPSGAIAFVDSVILPELLSQQEDTVEFSQFRIPSGEKNGIRYSLRIWTNQKNDQNKENDTIGGGFICKFLSLKNNSVILKSPKNNGFTAYFPSVSWEIPENKREEVLIQIDTTRNFELPLISEFTKDNYRTITKLPAGKLYYWRVKRLSNGVWSPIWQFQKLDWICNPANGSCYTVVYAGSAEMARNQAKEMGASPLTIRSKEESDWIQSTFGTEKTWLGYSNKGNSNKWNWYSNDKTDYTNWAPNQPNNSQGKENCAVLLEDGTWDDIGEYFEYRSIFEISKKIATIQNPIGGILAEVFPNPVSSSITIQFIQQQNDVQISLFTSNGAEVYNQNYSNVKETMINVSTFAVGAYSLVITSEFGTVTTSIMIYR